MICLVRCYRIEEIFLVFVVSWATGRGFNTRPFPVYAVLLRRYLLSPSHPPLYFFPLAVRLIRSQWLVFVCWLACLPFAVRHVTFASLLFLAN